MPCGPSTFFDDLRVILLWHFEQQPVRVDAKPSLFSHTKLIVPSHSEECFVNSSVYSCNCSKLIILLPFRSLSFCSVSVSLCCFFLVHFFIHGSFFFTYACLCPLLVLTFLFLLFPISQPVYIINRPRKLHEISCAWNCELDRVGGLKDLRFGQHSQHADFTDSSFSCVILSPGKTNKQHIATVFEFHNDRGGATD